MLTYSAILRFLLGPLSLLMICQAAMADDDGCAKSSDDSVGPADIATQNCYEAFCKLPDEGRQGRIPQDRFAEHILIHRDTYSRYEQACFTPWEELKDYSKQFLNDIYGALFYRADRLIFTCSAFRIAPDVIVTAKHCLYHSPSSIPSPTDFIFRSIREPTVDIPIVGELPKDHPSPKSETPNDSDDYWFLKLGKSGLSFNRRANEFRSTVRRGSWLLMVGINRLAYVLRADENEKKWILALRYTKVAGAQWIPAERLPPPTSAWANDNCIYHKAPSFGGLSGSPIIGADYDPASGRPPQLFVVGIHLRSGVPENPHTLDADCGSYPNYNIGLALPPDVLRRVVPVSPKE